MNNNLAQTLTHWDKKNLSTPQALIIWLRWTLHFIFWKNFCHNSTFCKWKNGNKWKIYVYFFIESFPFFFFFRKRRKERFTKHISLFIYKKCVNDAFVDIFFSSLRYKTCSIITWPIFNYGQRNSANKQCTHIGMKQEHSLRERKKTIGSNFLKIS